ncbi:flagellar basal body-associated FliL family protein [Caldithrix abyssi]|uniref:Flagellar protein FliL n=1 Tax=Caldithrix abyssi DSM 13497 TaxID=880073 RepID=H1XQ04_CALAY|nr:flagellar basal body-associated FliL family protein [Caldithrix abyssi]APF18230.1 flagellar FliL protein [Caldithrix abyssi DSM 13497]EHO42255.1 flagellar basal body-associated protein FliL [Caldithrix abyssi DSM 13497]
MAEEKVQEAKNPTKWGLIIALFGVQILVAVALVYFLILPRLSPASSGEPEAQKKEQKVDKKKPGILVTIDNLTINPKGSFGRRYAVFEVALEVPDEKAKAEIEKFKPKIVDAYLLYLRSKTVEDLTIKLDIDLMKQEMVEKVNMILGQPLVQNLYFTRFVLE